MSVADKNPPADPKAKSAQAAGTDGGALDNLLLVGTVMLAVTLVLGVWVFSYIHNRSGQALREYRKVGDFRLIERSGRIVSQDELKGRIVVVDFFFGGCSAQCLMLGRQMADLQQLTSGMDQVLLVSITVDPGSDTPKVLTGYANRLNADTNRWLFLTGDRKIIYPLIQESFLLAVADESNQSASPDPGFIHSDKIALVDRRGVVRAYYDGMAASAPEMILAGIKEVMAEKSAD
jgi:protein SCO1/2